VFQAVRQLGYGGQKRLQGEVFKRLDLRNDDRLVELKYVKEISDKGERPHCDQCGRDFANEDFYQGHFIEAHGPRLPDPAATKLEEEFPGGLVTDMRSGAVRAGRS
jgi:hypothetical protein